MSNGEFFQQVFQDGGAQTPAALDHFEDGADVRLDRQAPEDRWLLRQVAESEPRAAVERQAGHILPVDADMAAVRRG